MIFRRWRAIRIIIETIAPDEEDSVVIRVKRMTNNIKRAIDILERPENLVVSLEDQTLLVPTADVYYIESVDQKTFVYTAKAVYRSKLKLYEIEESLNDDFFLRISKQLILNITKIKSVSSVGGARFGATLTNGEMVIVSRQYVPALKERFGL